MNLNSTILKKAIEKAIANGWEMPREAFDFEITSNETIRFTSIDDETQDPAGW